MRVLSGWKEIATYLGRGVRTVQRWERLGLPVHRPKGSGRSAVTALAHEVEAWVAASPTQLNPISDLRVELERLRKENEFLRHQLASLTNPAIRGQAASS